MGQCNAREMCFLDVRRSVAVIGGEYFTNLCKVCKLRQIWIGKNMSIIVSITTLLLLQLESIYRKFPRILLREHTDDI